MTLAEIEKSTKESLAPADVVGILDCDANTLRIQAHRCPEKLGFPVVVMGKRVKIPRQGFLHFWKYGRTPVVITNRVGEE